MEFKTVMDRSQGFLQLKAGMDFSAEGDVDGFVPRIAEMSLFMIVIFRRFFRHSKSLELFRGVIPGILFFVKFAHKGREAQFNTVISEPLNKLFRSG